MQRILWILHIASPNFSSTLHVRANTHPRAFALSAAVITQCELRTCAAPPGAQPAAAICAPLKKIVGFAG